MPVSVSAYVPSPELSEWLAQRWGEPTVEWHHEVFHPNDLEGFVAHRDKLIGGVITFAAYPDRLHIVSVDASQRRQGIGSLLVARVLKEAVERGVKRITATTTNDNLEALAFFQYHGFQLTALRTGAALNLTDPSGYGVARAGTPAEPQESIVTRDEIDMEYVLPEPEPDSPS